MALEQWKEKYVLENFYDQTNQKIARVLGCSITMVSYYARRAGLKKGKRRMVSGCSFQEALPPEKHKDMEQFLKMLITYDKRARREGVKPNISTFISMYPVYMNGASSVGKGDRVRDSDIKRFISLHNKGFGPYEIARATGYCHDTVRRYIKKELEGGGDEQ